jgi:hypothetical protein
MPLLVWEYAEADAESSGIKPPLRARRSVASGSSLLIHPDAKVVEFKATVAGYVRFSDDAGSADSSDYDAAASTPYREPVSGGYIAFLDA